jgi:MFS family permease
LTFPELWKFKNVRVGVVVSSCMMLWIACTSAFLPKFITEVQGLPEAAVGKYMGLMGLSSLISGVVVSSLSDRFGRKPLVVIFSLVGIFYPLAIVFLQNSGAQLPVMFATYFFFGAFPIVLSAIPSETVPGHSIGKAIGIMNGTGEVIGGVIAPVVAGILADKYGMSMPFFMASVAAAVALIASFSFLETKKV